MDKHYCFDCALYTAWDEGEYGVDEMCSGLFNPWDNKHADCKGWFDGEKYRATWEMYPDLIVIETKEVIPYEEWIKTHKNIIVPLEE